MGIDLAKCLAIVFMVIIHCLMYFGADRSTTLIFEDAFHAIRTAKADGFKVVAVFDNSEKHQKEIHDLADFCLTDFDHTDGFWKFASAL